MEVVVGQPSSEKGGRLRLSGRMLIVAGIVAAFVVVAAGVGAWQYFNNRAKQSAKVDAAIAASEKAYNRADYTNALNLVRGMAGQATSAKQRAHVYQLQAQAAAAVGKLAEAAGYYELKHQADQGSAPADAYTLGTIYRRLDKTDKALAQYKVALEYAKKHQNQYTSDAPAIQAAIDELEQQK